MPFDGSRNSSAPGAVSRREMVPCTRSEPSGQRCHGEARSGAEQRFVGEVVVARVSRAVAHVEARRQCPPVEGVHLARVAAAVGHGGEGIGIATEIALHRVRHAAR